MRETPQQIFERYQAATAEMMAEGRAVMAAIERVRRRLDHVERRIARAHERGCDPWRLQMRFDALSDGLQALLERSAELYAQCEELYRRIQETAARLQA